jgi:IS605 OrfB family transposase
MIKTLKLRIKGNCKWLNKLALEVNFVWNYINDLSFKNIRDHGRFLSSYDMHPYLTGATKEGLSLRSHTIQEIAAIFYMNRYINICIDTEDLPSEGTGEVGIDLGLKTLATLSNGEKIETQNFYRDEEVQLAKAQRANKKKLVKAIHQKIKNKRKDFLHKISSKLIALSRLIVVGNVNSSSLAKTNMAKSVLDAGWYMFRTMLEYKAIRQQVKCIIINEAWTSQDCSECKARTGPKGLGDLGIREWTCSECGSIHDRDINAAKNILALGHESLVEGVSK